jgi:methionine-rich copper-binding protein CopC
VTRLASAALALAVLCGASAVMAHPLPRAATPAPNAVLTTSPAQISITFSEGLVAAFCGLELKDASGRTLPLGPASVNPQDHKQLAAPLKTPLGPGIYTVNWRAVGDDTHHVSGHYSFQVRP